MKTLYLLRHAKSSWSDSSLSDFDRPLNSRGKRDAPLIGKFLSENVIKPERVLSSPAKRAITTAKIVSNYFGVSEHELEKNLEIYEAVVSDLMRIINSTSDSINTLLLVGHNPTFTMISNYLSGQSIENIPTCGFVQIDFSLEKWNSVEGNTGKLIRFEYPKKHL